LPTNTLAYFSDEEMGFNADTWCKNYKTILPHDCRRSLIS
jgi:hypothetical protein